MPASKILIVDDEPLMCSSLKSLLVREGYDIETLPNGKAAKQYLSAHPVDLVLLDFVLPDLNGYQVMEFVYERFPDSIVIIMTGYASIDHAVEALKKGAYDYIQKPIEPEKLLKTIRHALEQKRLKNEFEIINGKLAIMKERYRYMVHNSPDIIYTLDETGKFTFLNQAAERLLGRKTETLIGTHFAEIVHSEDLSNAEWLFRERRTDERTNTGTEIRLILGPDVSFFSSLWSLSI